MVPETNRSVAVTGIGMITSLGGDRETSWRAIADGEVGVDGLDQDETVSLPIRIGARVKQVLEPETEGHAPARFSLLALAAAREAVSDAGLSGDASIGCIIGSSRGGLDKLLEARQHLRRGTQPAHDLMIHVHPGAASAYVCAALGLGGPRLSLVSACASGAHAVIEGARQIRSGTADCLLVGAAEAPLVPLVICGFHRLGVLARHDGDPRAACRPFDARRRGFVLGEGAAVLALEEMTRARRRGARIYGVLSAETAMANAHDMVYLEPNGAALAHAITTTLRSAHLPPEEVDYINLHGTGTVANDVVETKALKKALGARAGRVALSSTKAAVGHTLGAAGAIELAVALLAMRDGVIPPTANLEQPDPQCDLDYTPLVASRRSLRNVMSISMGFGGHIAVIAARPAAKG